MTAKNSLLISLTLLILVATVTILWLASEPIIEAVGLVATPLAVGLAFFLVLGLGGLSALLIWSLYQGGRRRHLTTQLLATEVEERRRRARFQIITAAPGEQIIIGDLVTKDWHNKTLDPRPYSNGRDSARPPEAVELAVWERYHQLHATAPRPQPGQGAVPLIEGPEGPDVGVETMPLDPRPILKEKPHLWLIGETRSGKTSLAMHWLDLRPGEKYVIDPKPPGLNPWPGGATVGGNNGNEAEAVELYQHFMYLAGERINTGQLDGAPLTLLIDETMFVVATMADNTGQSARETWGKLHKMSAICAEYRIHLAITSTSPEVAAVGADGLSGLLNNYAKFETVKMVEAGGPAHKLYYYPKTTDRHAKHPVANLGPYRGGGVPRRFDAQETKRAEAQRLLNSGLSERQVCLRLLGGDGGEQYAQLRRLLGS